jgi:ribonuclease HI
MQGRKSDHSADGIRSLFLDHINTCHRRCMHIYTDGSKDDSRVGCAAVSDAARSSLRLHSYSSIFTAELYGILCAIAIARESTNMEICIFSDSLSAIQAILCYNSPHPLVTTIHRWLIRLHTRQKTITFCWVPGHVKITGNEAADELSRRAAAEETPPWNDEVPHRDHYPIFRRKLLDEWQGQWTRLEDNKLRKIKDSVRPWPSSSHRVRRVEVCLTRLRIGHTRITHGHLMERTPAPYCMDCLVPQTIIHVLCECPSFGVARRQFFPHLSQNDPDTHLKSILAQPEHGSYNVDRLVEYLRAINMFDCI